VIRRLETYGAQVLAMVTSGNLQQLRRVEVPAAEDDLARTRNTLAAEQ
jgi:hypothetical protein